jgi:hypothetical protein
MVLGADNGGWQPLDAPVVAVVPQYFFSSNTSHPGLFLGAPAK